ncbi:MAG: hypothetical protein V4651_14740 [Bacteroidota bacterium]
MKHPLLFTLLLGFGLAAPLTCAKQKDKKSSAEETKQHHHAQPKKMALYAPAGTIKQAQGRV